MIKRNYFGIPQWQKDLHLAQDRAQEKLIAASEAGRAKAKAEREAANGIGTVPAKPDGPDAMPIVATVFGVVAAIIIFGWIGTVSLSALLYSAVGGALAVWLVMAVLDNLGAVIFLAIGAGVIWHFWG